MVIFFKLLPLLFAVFIDSLGFGLVVPIFSPLIINNEGGIFSPETSVAFRGFVFGILISSFCIGQFFSGPLLGAISDRRGRKKVIIATVWLACLGYLLAGLGIFNKNLFFLFLARVVGGIAAGNYGVAQSVIADTFPEKDKAKNFGLVGMSWWTGFIIGPFLGGKLAAFGLTAPFWIAACFCFGSIILLHWKMKESYAPAGVPSKVNFLAGIWQIKKAFGLAHLRGVFLIMFVVSLGWGFFTEFSPVFLIRYFGFNLEQIANFYAWLGLWVAVSQGLLIRPFFKKFALEHIFPMALLGLGLVLPIMLWLNGPVGLFWLLPLVGIGEALIFPTATAIVSNLSDKTAQGEMLGIHNSVQWAAIAISPIFSGSLVALYPSLPIVVSSSCMICSFLLAIWFFRRKKEPTQESTTEVAEHTERKG
ncbi:MAG: MFS transporter [Chlamydiae bacterium]|nr:MFS transporter [Chlamydiota bacterium]